MLQLFRNYYSKFFYIVACLATVLLVYKTMVYHWLCISHPYLLQYRESVAVLTTEAFRNGLNPYSIDMFPIDQNAYGAILSLFTLPFTYFFDNTLLLHRAISAFFGLLCSFIVVLILKERKVLPIYWGIAVIILHSSLLFHKTMTAEPDCIGIFLVLLGLYINHKYKFSTYSIFTAIVLAILAFYVKMYFFYLGILISSYLFLFISKKKGIYTFLSFIAIYFLSLLLAYKFIPSFIHLAMFNSIYQGYFVSYIILQITNYSIINIGIILLFVLLISYWGLIKLKLQLLIKLDYISNTFDIAIQAALRLALKNIKERLSFNITKFNAPFFSTPFLDIYQYALSVGIFLVIFILGGTYGAYLYYHFTFVTPFLVIVTFSLTTSVRIYKQTVVLNKLGLLQYFSIILGLLGAWGTFANKGGQKTFSEVDKTEWEKVRKYIRQSKEVLGTPEISMLIHEAGKMVYDNGHTEYLLQASPKSISIIQKQQTVLFEKNKQYVAEIKRKVKAQEFEMIYWHETENLANITKQEIQVHYYIADSAVLNMPHTLGHRWKGYIWKLKTNIKL